MARINPLNPTGALDHTIAAQPGQFFAGGQLQQLLGGLMNPGGGAGGQGGAGGAGGYGGVPQSALQAIQAKIDEANAANEQRYSQGLGVIDQGKTDMVTMLQDLFGQILGAGVNPNPALQRESRRATDATNSAQAQLTMRGLGNTNLLADVGRGVADDSAIRTEEIHNNANSQANNWRAQLAQMLMGVFQNYSREKSGFIERRSDIGPDLGQLASIYSQPGATGDVSLLGGALGRRSGAPPVTMGGWNRPGAQAPQIGAGYGGSINLPRTLPQPQQPQRRQGPTGIAGQAGLNVGRFLGNLLR